MAIRVSTAGRDADSSVRGGATLLVSFLLYGSTICLDYARSALKSLAEYPATSSAMRFPPAARRI